MRKKLVLITGTTSGLGLEAAKQLAKMNYRLVLACRDVFLANQQAEAMTLETGNEDIEVMRIDLASFDSIENFVCDFASRYSTIDVLINNAGVFSDTSQKTIEGFELTMGVNFIGNYYLTKLLLSQIKAWENARIVNVVSKAAFFGKLNIKENFMKNHSHGFRAYSASKLAELMMTIELSEKLKNRNITVNAAHPGEVSTNMWNSESLIMKLMVGMNKKRYDNPKDACKTIVYLASSDDVEKVSGLLFQKTSEIMQYNKRILDRKKMHELIEYTDEIIDKIKSNNNSKII